MSTRMLVHVWMPTKKLVGHAALSYQQLDFASYRTIEYLSFWPYVGTKGSTTKEAKQTDVITRRHHYSKFSKSVADDRATEKMPETYKISIKDFDDIALNMFIMDLKRKMPKYHLSKYNCSSVVAEALHKATGRKPRFRVAATGYGNLVWMFGRGVWTPKCLLRYANQLAET